MFYVPKEKRVINYFAKNQTVFTASSAALAIGVAAGAFMAARLSGDEAASLAADIIQSVGNASGTTSFSKSLLQNSQSVLLFWVLGMSVVGAPLLLAAIGVKGYAVGYTVGFLVRSFGLTGFLASASGVLPHNLLIVPCYVLLAGFGICFSKTLLKGGRDTKGQFTAYTLKAVLIFAVILSGSVFEGYISSGLMKNAMSIVINQG